MRPKSGRRLQIAWWCIAIASLLCLGPQSPARKHEMWSMRRRKWPHPNRCGWKTVFIRTMCVGNISAKPILWIDLFLSEIRCENTTWDVYLIYTSPLLLLLNNNFVRVHKTRERDLSSSQCMGNDKVAEMSNGVEVVDFVKIACGDLPKLFCSNESVRNSFGIFLIVFDIKIRKWFALTRRYRSLPAL